MASGRMTVEAGYRELKARKDAVKMVVLVQLGGAISPRKAKKCNRGVGKAYEELKEMYGEENEAAQQNEPRLAAQLSR